MTTSSSTTSPAPLRGAVTQIGSGAFDLTKGSLRLCLLASTYGLALLRTVLLRTVTSTGTAGPTEQVEPMPVAEIATAAVGGRRGKTALRIGLVAALVAAVVAGAAAIARKRGTAHPEPAAEPPSLRADTNGGVTAESITMVEDF